MTANPAISMIELFVVIVNDCKLLIIVMPQRASS